MNAAPIPLCDIPLLARATGALWQPGARALCVSDLHLGKSERLARAGGALLPPYENLETLSRLSDEVEAMQPEIVICLGDSFDDMNGANALDDECRDLLLQMQAGRRWIWIEGNHDPGPISVGGEHRATVSLEGLTYRHIAQSQSTGEISGHFHPKVAIPGGGSARRCFVWDGQRCILPAFGVYTGGLSARSPVIRTLFKPEAFAVLTGRRPMLIPLIFDGDRQSSRPRQDSACRSG